MRRKHKTSDGFRFSRRRPTLSSKLLLYLAAFMAVLLAVLWICQVCLLDRFYYQVTQRDMKHAASQFDGVSDAELSGYTDAVAAGYEYCVVVTNGAGETLSVSREQPNSVIAHWDAEVFRSLREKANAAGGTYFRTFSYEDIGVPASPGEETSEENGLSPILPQPSGSAEQENGAGIGGGLPVPLPDGESQSEPSYDGGNGGKRHGERTNGLFAARNLRRLICVRLVKNSEGAERTVLLDCALTPVNAVRRTITVQLSIVTVLCLLGSLLLAFLLSRRISRPLSEMSRSAGKLASGDYRVAFRGGVCREIDELSDSLSYAGQELSKLKEMQNELIANISHDLRTPLTMISGYAEVMRDLPGENTPENAQVIIDETERLKELVNNLLDVSRAGEDAGRLNAETLCLSDLLSETVERFRKLNECKGYTFRYHGTDGVTVLADRQKLLQVIYNLIGNAVNYTGADRTVTVEMTVGADVVRVDVKDSGEGIPEENLPHIWDRYYRGENYHRRSVVGVGLGLSIVKEILDAHGAAYGVMSECGKGSDFWFKLHTVRKEKE